MVATRTTLQQKPQEWAAERYLVAPEWQWAWDGLVGHWIMWEGGGAPRDISGTGNQGSLFGASWVASERGVTLDFDGTDDYIEVPYSATLNPSVFTVSVWANALQETGPYRSAITSRNNQDGSEKSGYIIYASQDDIWEFWLGNDSAWEKILGPDIEPGEWTHLVGVFDGTTQSFYINGVLIESRSAGMLQNDSKPLRIGSGETESTNYWDFEGQVDDVRIYNRALNPAEIKALYEDPWGPVTPALPASALFVPAAGGGATVPIFHRHYQGLRSA